MQVIRDKIMLISFILGVTLTLMRGITYGGEIMDEVKDEVSGLKMSYRIEGAYSPYKYVQVEISGPGEGRLSYELYREYVGKNQKKEDVIEFNVDEVTVKELMALYQRVDFLNLEVVDLNKDKIRVTDVGTTTLSYSYQGKERQLSYGYIENNPLEELINQYYELAKEYLPK